MDRERQIVFFPCCHLTSCQQCSTQIDDKHSILSIDEVNNNLSSLLCLNDGNDQINEMEDLPSQSMDDDELFAEINMQSLGTLTLQLGDIDDQHLATNREEMNHNNSNHNSPESMSKSNESISNKSNSSNSISGNPVGKKVMSGFKNIKDKVKNISLNKENKLPKTPSIDLSKTNHVIDDDNVNQSSVEIVKAETDKIFDKYRNSTKQHQHQQISNKKEPLFR